MKNRVLIIGVGISSTDTQKYGHESVTDNSRFVSLIENYYDEIVYFYYQEILDRGAFIGKTLLDPIRLKIKGATKNHIVGRFEGLVNRILSQGKEVHILGHSLFCWVSQLAELKVEKVIHCGSPVGFATPILRFIVRNDIARFPWTKPKLQANKFINLYSTSGWLKEPVGTKPFIKDNRKWALGAELAIELDTKQTHDFSDYIEFLVQNRRLIYL